MTVLTDPENRPATTSRPSGKRASRVEVVSPGYGMAYTPYWPKLTSLLPSRLYRTTPVLPPTTSFPSGWTTAVVAMS